jgi:phage terminase large subunit GpA-like protein
MMASQTGKTMAIIFVLEYIVKVLKKAIISVRATRDTAIEWMRDKFLPTVESTPALKGLIKDPRQKGSNSTAMSRKFPGGFIKTIGAKSPSAFRGTSAPVIVQDEIDSYAVTKEGDPMALADRAAKTFSEAIFLKSSTPTLVNVSRIFAGFMSGDQQYYFLPCCVCGEFQHLKTEQLKFSFTAEEYEIIKEPGFKPSDHTWKVGEFSIKDTKNAMYVCEHCNHGWTDSQRIQAYMSGHTENSPIIVNGVELRARWQATAPFNGIRSRHLSGLYMTIGLKKGYDTYLEQFSEEFLAAVHGGKETLMVWTNIFKCWVFEDAHEKVDWEKIKDRAEDYDARIELPAQVVWIAGGVDVHPDRIEISFYGWGDEQEAWALEHHIIYGDFDMPSMQDTVEEYLIDKKFHHEVLGDLHVSAIGFDSGHQTKVYAVYKFCSKHRWRNFWSIKGFDNGLGDSVQRHVERRYGGLRFNLNTDFFKNMFFDHLKNEDQGARRVHFPKHFSETYFRQLCSEKRITIKNKFGGYVSRWVKFAQRNETLDCAIYAFAIFEICRQDESIHRKWIEVKNELAKREQPAVVEHPEVMNIPSERKDPSLPKIDPHKPTPPPKPRQQARFRYQSPFSKLRF